MNGILLHETPLMEVGNAVFVLAVLAAVVIGIVLAVGLAVLAAARGGARRLRQRVGPRVLVRRLVVGLFVAAVWAGGLGAAEKKPAKPQPKEDVMIPEICPTLEPYSAQWFLHWCWLY